MDETILICTVGGSHEPVVTSIRQYDPNYVYFLCTDPDRTTGEKKSGSRRQIEGTGTCLKAHKDDDKPTLPNIPTQADLSDEQYEIVIVPSDDLDAIYNRTSELLRTLIGESGDGASRIIADYTGGTKSMTAAVILAALEFDQVEISFVTGARANLERVHAGTESVVSANVDRLRLSTKMRPYLYAWTQYAYDQAQFGLEQIATPKQADLRPMLIRARSLSQGFALWDRFDHRGAQQALEPFRNPLAQAGFHKLFASLDLLSARDDDRTTPIRLFDLWRNAQRRAVQGRYDDAVARCYRLLEWIAHWMLERDAHVDAGNAPEDKIPNGMSLRPNHEGRITLGLFQSWEWIERARVNADASTFYEAHKNKIRDLIKSRNASILAHGQEPITRDVWQRWEDWMEQALMPLLLQLSAQHRVHDMPPQLPDAYPSELLQAMGRQVKGAPT